MKEEKENLNNPKEICTKKTNEELLIQQAKQDARRVALSIAERSDKSGEVATIIKDAEVVYNWLIKDL